MASVSLDEKTIDELQMRAAAQGMTVDAYVKSLLTESPTTGAPRLSWKEVESLLIENAHDGPTLPPGFSRADIYYEHD
jgi:hypothetical protein